jgi:endonuclease IV
MPCRSQSQNKEDCIKKLREMVKEAYIEPKERKVWEGLGEITKEKRRQEKNYRKNVKEVRRSRSDFD